MYVTYLVVIKTVSVCSNVVTFDVYTDEVEIADVDFFLVVDRTISVRSADVVAV